ncbi:complex III assembly factor LYRM7-like [Babylonia areolata]|uniref:complex III assembly factor LYRM7-like n=1 Tax=Babylonia areolata TaxID=304850 RepID=UPI003FD6129A
MALASRGRVLSVFKEIHRTCQFVFAGDAEALAAGRLKINDEFKEKKDETDPQKIEEYIQIASDSAKLLRKTIVQAKLSEDGTGYSMKITKDTQLNDNIMYDPNVVVPVRPRRRKKSPCQETKQT